MTLLSRLQDELIDAGDRMAERQTHRRRRHRLLGVVLGGTVLVSGVAVAATIWQPQLGSEQRGRPSADAQAPPAQQLERFAVLRRHPTARDRGTLARYALTQLAPHHVDGVRTEYVRVLDERPDGTGEVLIPAASADAGRDALCLFSRDAVDGGGIACYTTAEVLAGNATLAMAGAPPEEPSRPQPPPLREPLPDWIEAIVIGIVPDGVEQVRIAGTTATVTENHFRATVNERAISSSGPIDVTWLDGSGSTVSHRP